MMYLCCSVENILFLVWCFSSQMQYRNGCFLSTKPNLLSTDSSYVWNRLIIFTRILCGQADINKLDVFDIFMPMTKFIYVNWCREINHKQHKIYVNFLIGMKKSRYDISQNNLCYPNVRKWTFIKNDSQELVQ